MGSYRRLPRSRLRLTFTLTEAGAESATAGVFVDNLPAAATWRRRRAGSTQD
jgi:hypothetical protein